MTSTDTALVTIINPAIAISKTPDSQRGEIGQPVTFTITITNTGDVTLAPITVTDALAPDCDAVIGSLASGLTSSTTCSVIAGTADFTNTAVVTGAPPVGNVVTAVDTAFVDAAPPERPRLISPPDQSYTNNQTVTFSWSPTADTVTYTLNLSGTLYNVAGPSTTHTPAPLSEGVYSWTVRSVDVYSRTLGYTDTWQVTVDITPPAPPPAQTLPSNGAVISTTARPAFDWDDSFDALSGPVTYTISITDSTGLRVYSTTATSIFTPSSDLPTGVYTWTVTAYDRAGNASASTQAFTVTMQTVVGDIYLPLIVKNYAGEPPPGNYPDLIVSDIALTQISGNTYRVQVTARNQSATAVTYGNNFHVNVYLDGDYSSPIITWGVQGSYFGAGQSVVLEQDYTLSSGPHTLRGWADPYNVVVESDETNNTRDEGVTISGSAANVGAQDNRLGSSGPQPTPTNTP